MTPVMLETPTGWLAVSPSDSSRRIGVHGSTIAEAKAEFAAAVARRERLAEDDLRAEPT